ncbi:MAG: PTS sugar transporter subunit IIA [Clostridia bacterium]|nr:PTS sugar transporter subunit IIA [Clostridia bacterium]
MRLTEQMDEKGICVGVTLKGKDGIIDILAALQQKCGNTEDGKRLRREIYYREEEASFAIGAGVAVCFLRSTAIKRPLITAVTAPFGVDLGAPDGERCRLIFLAAAPSEENEDPTPALTVLLMHEDLREQLMEAADERTFLELLRMAEDGGYSEPSTPQKETPLILAVLDDKTESATEAAAQLQLAAGRTGVLLKIEKGDAPLFSDDDIQEAAGIIIIGEHDELDRFDGKAIQKISASDGIYRPEYILRSLENAPVYHKKIKLKLHKKGLQDWYYRSNVPLLPLILLSGGLLMFAGEILHCFAVLPSLGGGLRWLGERSLLLLIPRVCGMIGFRYLRWSGLAVGLIGGGVLELLCGGPWGALLGGVVTVFTVRWSERGVAYLPKKFHWLEWLSPVIGILAVSGLGLFLNVCYQWIHKGVIYASGILDPLAKGLLFGAGIGMDPGGLLNRAVDAATPDPAVSAAMTASGLAISFGLTLYAILFYKKIDKNHCANGWSALPAGLCGAVQSYLVFYAGDPFRVAISATCGGGAAGLLAVSLGCSCERGGVLEMVNSDHPILSFIAVLCGAILCCAMLFALSRRKLYPHEV